MPLAVEHVVEATRHALSLARSGFLYVVATINMIESRKGDGLTLPVLLQDQRKPRASDEYETEWATQE